ncbi:MAG: dephospho-CoA kinase [Hyphomicrobiales bacterium]|nr:MAG: dephospho-CoA kinase [Hyphomicrobiales bacterium]
MSGHRLPRLGLTGGIGSGKSTYGDMLQSLGCALVDADQISRSLTAVGGQAIEAVSNEFGPAFVTPEGAMDRGAMRSLIFADATAKHRLESIIHPLVGAAIEQAADTAKRQHSALLVLDIPLLVESSRWAPQLDAVVVIDCTEETQIARVQARSGLDRETALSIIAAQSSREARRSAADIVVFNEGLSLTDLFHSARQTAALFGL